MTERSQLLTYKEKNEQKSNQLLFITTYNPAKDKDCDRKTLESSSDQRRTATVLRTKAKIGVPEEQKSSRLHRSNNHQKQQGFEEKGLV